MLLVQTQDPMHRSCTAQRMLQSWMVMACTDALGLLRPQSHAWGAKCQGRRLLKNGVMQLVVIGCAFAAIVVRQALLCWCWKHRLAQLCLSTRCK